MTYIDRDKVLAIIENHYQNYLEMHYYREALIVDNIKEDIKKLPTADVAEVKHARWLPSPDGVCPIRCSSCNTPALWCHGEDDFGYAERRYASCFCPYCGARMDGKVQEVE